MTSSRAARRRVALLLSLAATPAVALAQSSDLDARLAEIESANGGAQSAGDTARVLVWALLTGVFAAS